MANKYSDNWKESWNEEDWQGKTEKQVSYSHLVVGVSLTLLIGFTILQIFL